MSKNKTIISLLGISLWVACSFAANHENLLLTSPLKSGSEQEILHSFESVGGIFGGLGYQNSRGAYFTYSHGKVGFILRYFDMLPEQLTEDQKAQFTHIVVDGKDVYEYYGGCVAAGHKDASIKMSVVGSHGHIEPYEPLEYNNVAPKLLTVQEAAQLIKEKNIVLLTGAGLSAAAGIETLPTLWSKLGRNLKEPVDDFVINVLDNSTILEDIIQRFYKSARDNQPTAAHYAVTQLACYKQCAVLTGNFDRLHERAGIIPYRVMYELIDEDIDPQDWRSVDIVVTVGTRWDFRAILTRFKAHNPQGLILAINLEQPEYLSEHDYFLAGDLQQIVPSLVDNIIKRPYA